ncbi:hypothetical protein ACFX2I_006302 [Malus domestica]
MISHTANSAAPSPSTTLAEGKYSSFKDGAFLSVVVSNLNATASSFKSLPQKLRVWTKSRIWTLWETIW